MTCHDCFADLMEESYEDGVSQIRCPFCDKILELVKPNLLRDGHVFIYVDDSNMWIEAKKLAAKQSNLKCVEDPRLRLDIGRMADVVASGREVAWGILYGSEPPPIDTVWEKIRERGWKVVTTKRSRFTNKEKQVDHQMVADMTALVSDRSVAKGKILIVSGDADVIPAIREGLRKKWSFEIWMWESGISNALKHLAEENPDLLTISPLDPRLGDISFTNFKISEEQRINPRLDSRSAVIKNFKFSPNEAWQKNLSEKLSWPFQFCWVGPERLGNPLDFEDVRLIFSSGVKSKDDKKFGYHFEKIFETLEKEYPGKVVNYPAYRNECDKKEEICLTNRYGALEDVDEGLSMNNTSDLSDERGAAARNQQGRGECGTDSKHGGELDEEEDDSFQDVQRQHRKRTQQYSEQCKYYSNCRNGLKCSHSHTDAEKEFFRNPRKDRECRFKKYCKHGSKCKFAHSDEGSFCRECHQWGHLREKCL